MTSQLEATLAFQLQAEGITDYQAEYRFAPPRRWRADLYLPAADLLVDVQGGIYVNGKHSRGAAQEKDYEKANTAQIMGFRFMQFGPSQIRSGEALATIKRALEAE